jgi:hypothetical protein
MFTGTCHWSLSWPRWIQFTPYNPISLRYILISSHLHLGLPSGLIPPVFPTKILYAYFPYPMHATCTTHLLLDLITLIITVKYICYEAHYAVFSSFPLLPPS